MCRTTTLAYLLACLKAVDLFDAVADGRIKALWIAATNPAVSMPRAGRVREALRACPFVVVSDCWPTDTSALAHVVLPAAGWGEKDGTVTSSERRISRQRAFRAAPGEARPDWWQFAQVGRRMGWNDAFAWTSPAAIFREHAALSAHANNGQRVFDIGAMADLSDADYGAMQPFRWPLPTGAATEAGRLFAEGGLPTPDGKARFVPTPYWPAPRAGAGGVLLNTGRIRDQWHTMTRTGLVPALMTHTPEPAIALHPVDAAAAGITDGGLARLRTEHGQIILKAELRYGQRRGEAFVPMHWTDAFTAAGPIDRVVTARVDPVSGQPELKATPATVEPVTATFHGLLLRRSGGVPVADLWRDLCHWVRIPVTEGELYRLSGLAPMPSDEALSRFAAALTQRPAEADWLEMADSCRGVLRVAVVIDGAVEASLFLARDPSVLPVEQAVVAMLGAPVPESARASILSGRMYGSTANEGPTMCACFGVSRAAVRHAIATGNLVTAKQVGERLRAGTNCGSCIPEIEEILRDLHVPAE